MSGSQLIMAISLYITSMAFAVIISIVIKNNTAKKRKLPLLIHVVLFAFFLFAFLFMDQPLLPGYLFLFFFCSGIITGGYLIRSNAPLLLRFYFTLYISSILLFLYSPSMLIRAMTLKLDNIAQNDPFRLADNYYLEEEQMLMQVSDSMATYKITQHFGVFHKTLARDLRFGNRLDSIKILSFNPANGADIRGYISSKSPTFEGIDSIELHAVFNSPSKAQILRKQKNK